MKKITNVTKRQIKDVFCNGVDVGIFELEYQLYLYWGKCESELSFLKRLYPLDIMPSTDSRYQNAEYDIIQHTINNDDWEYGWIFDDERFHLHNGTDEEYLKFIIEVFNPEVCVEGEVLNKVFSQIQNLLHEDGYELYVSEKVSGKPVYSWRLLTTKEIQTKKFLPFSVRFEEELTTKKIIVPSITKSDRRKIYELMGKYEETYCLTSETGWNYTQLTKEAVWCNIKEYYTPKSFNEKKEYVETDNLENFIIANYPKYVFDSIELYKQYTENALFEIEINRILAKYGSQLVDGKVQKMKIFQIAMELPQKDESLISLLQQAQAFINENNSESIQLALEKIWDALERIKTTYNEKNKKESAKELVQRISCYDKDIADFLENEINFLTKIGNEYQIRHFEKDKNVFPSEELKKYFYNRCTSLVNLCVCQLNQSKQ